MKLFFSKCLASFLLIAYYAAFIAYLSVKRLLEYGKLDVSDIWQIMSYDLSNIWGDDCEPYL